MVRQVTENDLRKDEFKDVDIDKLEFRADGKIVRKDRWESAVLIIASKVGVDVRNFEIIDVLNAIDKLVKRKS